jgi:amino acid adenylation domain-containing protein
LHHLFEDQVARSPHAPAVIFDHQQLSYLELEQRANQLAHHLLSLGIEAEARVGVCVERSCELVVALLAILKAGAAYVPLDPSYPPDRLAYMLADSNTRVVLTQHQLLPVLRRHTAAHTLCLDTDWTTIASQPVQPPIRHTTASNLAYVMYTSGSTGSPKGVAIEHRALVNHMAWLQRSFQLTASDRVLHKTPISFDVSAWELFWPLLYGAQLVVAPPGAHQDAAYLVETIAEQHITTVYFVASMLQLFVDQPGLETCQSLRYVFCGGEAIPTGLPEQLFARLDSLQLPTRSAVRVRAPHPLVDPLPTRACMSSIVTTSQSPSVFRASCSSVASVSHVPICIARI